jgi:hypothetical protein
MERIDLAKKRISKEVLSVMPPSVARMYSILPIQLANRKEAGEEKYALEVVVGDDLAMGFWADQYQKELDFVMGRKVVPRYVAPLSQIETVMNNVYG